MPTRRNNSRNNHITVFLGSSNRFNYVDNPNNVEAKALKKIVTSIHANYPDVSVKPWWEYPSGDEYILERVTDNIFAADFCIFVIARDVETTEVKDNNQEEKVRLSVPNSNVLIEMGIAVSKRKRILLLNWDPGQVKIPSDFGGKFYTPVERNGRNINYEKVNKSFREVYDHFLEDRQCNTVLAKYKNINLYYNRDLATKLTSPIPPGRWGTKALFIGTKSSAYWSAIEEDDQYPETSIIKDFLNQQNGITWDEDHLINSINEIVIDNIVSFGPGAGTIDDDLVRYFRRGSYLPFYIPIDISIPLVTKAIDNISANACFPIPFAIVDDFEEGHCFERLNELIRSKEYEIHKRNLFSIVGVTFSNYSKAEHYFLDGVLRIMDPEDDYLLLDVVADDIPEKELEKKVYQQINGLYKDLIVHSIRKRFPKLPRKMTVPSIMKGVHVAALDGSKYSFLTSVNGTRVVECSYQYKQKSSSIIIVKHYKYEEFKAYLKEKFVILASAYDGVNLRGLFLLKKKY